MLGQVFFYLVLLNDFLAERVCTSFFVFDWDDDAGQVYPSFILQCSDDLLCHDLNSLLDFLVNGITLEDRIKLLELQAAGGILTIFRRDVARGTGLTRSCMFGALHDHLNPVLFSFLCHLQFFLRDANVRTKGDNPSEGGKKMRGIW